jgi:hypothetical protein
LETIAGTPFHAHARDHRDEASSVSPGGRRRSFSEKVALWLVGSATNPSPTQ